jgi:uncharacterized protein
MDIATLIVLIITGLAAGFLAGTMGIGGGVVVVPMLVLVLGLSQREAQGTSLTFMLAPIGILAAYNYYKEGYINVKFAIILAVFFIIGSYLGSLIAVQTPDKILKKAFGIILVFTGLNMIFNLFGKN